MTLTSSRLPRRIPAAHGRAWGRLAWGAGLSAVALVAFFSAAPLLLSGEFVRERVVAHLANATGATVRVSRSHVALYPRPRVVMENVRLGATHLGGAEARVDRLEVDVALLPALGGRIVPIALRAERPHILLRHDARSPQAVLPTSPLPWPNLAIRDGRVDWQSRGRTIRVTAVDATISAAGRGATLAGSAVWNGEPVAFETSTRDLAALASRGTGARVTVTSNPLSFAFDGTLDLPAGQATGRTVLETKSMERAVEWLGLAHDAPAVPFSLRGNATANAAEAAFRKAALRVGDVEADGSLTVERRSSRVVVGGTLAFGNVAVPDVSVFHVLSAPGDARTDLRLPHLTALDLDLRLSAARLDVAGTRLDEVAATLRTGANDATLTIGDAVVGGGHAQGRLRFQTVRGDTKGTVTLAAKDVDLAALSIPALDGSLRPTGRGDATLVLSARGRSTEAMLASLAGRGSVAVRSGSLQGFDLGAAARATVMGALPKQDAVWNGATPFQHMSAAFRLRDGVAALHDLQLTDDRLAARLRGRIDLVRGAVALRGDLTSARERAVFRSQGGFFVGGTLLTPLLVPIDAIEPPPETHRSG